MFSYRALLARPGARRAATASGLGWWAFSGYGLALVLAAQHATGSFAVAGASTAAFAVGSALLAPVRGRAVDRGGIRVLALLAVAHTAALVALVVACALPAPSVWPLVTLAGLAGATAPPLSASARLAWVRVAGPELTRTAHAVNATLGDAAAVASPVLTSVIASALSPVVALAVLVPGTGAAVVALAGFGRPTERRAGTRSSRRSVLWASPGLRWLMAGDVASGMWLGALEVAAAALSVGSGHRLLAGIPLFGLAVGGIAASLWTGTARGSAAPALRYRLGAVGAAVVLPLVLVSPGVATLAVVSTAAGIGYGLINVALLELIDDVAEPEQAIEAFTWITTAQATGLAIGAAGAGALAEVQPAHALYLVAAAPLAGAAAAIAGWRYFQVAL